MLQITLVYRLITGLIRLIQSRGSDGRGLDVSLLLVSNDPPSASMSNPGTPIFQRQNWNSIYMAFGFHKVDLHG